jgi:hypothetical protein
MRRFNNKDTISKITMESIVVIFSHQASLEIFNSNNHSLFIYHGVLYSSEHAGVSAKSACTLTLVFETENSSDVLK